VAKFIENNNLMWLALTGGESFLRTDIAEILHMAMMKYASVSISTNGSQPGKIEQSVMYALKGNDNILSINLSLDGDKAQHDKFTRRDGSFERVTETVDRLKALNNKRVSINIQNLVSPITADGWDWVQKYTLVKNIRLTYSIEMRADSYYRNEDIPFVKPQMPPMGWKISLQNPFTYLYIRKGRQNKHLKCVASTYTVSITPDGFTKPCWFLKKQCYNIRDTNYKLISLDCKDLVDKCEMDCLTPCEGYPAMMLRPWRIL
jgi:MoaA/NifB/PqqE/SkfB family radical SAM enzyme